MTTQATPISLGKAAKKYNIPEQTLSRWVEKGILTVLRRPERRGQALLVDEATVALAAFQRTPYLRRAAAVGPGSPAGGLVQPFAPVITPPAVDVPPMLSTKELVDAFHRHNESLSSETQTWYDARLYPFADHFPTLPTRSEQVEEYISYCRQTKKGKQGKEVSQRYLWGIFNAIKTFYHYLVDQEIITERQSPMPRAGKVGPRARGPQKPKLLPRTLTDQEVVNLIQSASNYEERVMAELLFLSGIRSGELCSLTMDNVFPDHIKVKGKTGEHVYRITTELYNAIKVMGREGHVFLDRSGNPLKPDGVFQRIQKMAKKAGIKGAKLGPHTLRHTFGRIWQRETGDLVTLQTLLGHSQITTTRVYAEMEPGEVDKKYREHGPQRILTKGNLSSPTKKGGKE